MKAVISQTNKTKTNKESFAVNLVTVVAGCIAGIFADYALTQAQIQLFASPSVNLFFSGGGLKLFVFWGALFAVFWVKTAIVHRHDRGNKPIFVPLITTILMAMAFDSFFQYSELSSKGVIERQGLFSFTKQRPLSQISSVHIFYGKGRDDRVILKNRSGRIQTLDSSDSPNYFNQILSVDQTLNNKKIPIHRIGSPLRDKNYIDSKELVHYYDHRLNESRKHLFQVDADIKKKLKKTGNWNDWEK